jgi:hypothetical protein
VGNMHRRKTSKEAGENGNGDVSEPSADDTPRTPSAESEILPESRTSVPNGHHHSSPHSRTRTLPAYGSGPRLPSSPSRNHLPQRAPSLGVYDRPPPSAPSSRQTFGSLAPPPAPNSSHRHGRAPSLYEPLYGGNPPSAPPTRQSFGLPTSPTKVPLSPFRTTFPPPSPSAGSSGNSGSPQSLQPVDPRRRSHARVHSRNLSVYFPRPGAASGAPVASIAEDGDGDMDGQEIEIGGANGEAPIQLIPPPNANGRGFADGFKFGGMPADASASNDSTAPKRRGSVLNYLSLSVC